MVLYKTPIYHHRWSLQTGLKNKIKINVIYFPPAIQKTYDGLLTHFLCKLLI